MAIKQVYMQVTSASGTPYQNMSISVRVQASDAPGKIYRQVNDTRFDFVRYEFTTTDSAGQVNFWTEDGTTYTFRVQDPNNNNALVDQLFDITVGTLNPIIPASMSQQATLNLVSEDDALRLANYYGIFNTTGNDVSTAFQAYHDDVFNKGGSFLRLPRMNLVVHDIKWHPAVSLYGSNRYGTQILVSSGTTCSIRVLARTQSDANLTSWEPTFQDFSIQGQASTQSAPVDGILFEAASLDPDYASHTGSARYSSGYINNVNIENCSGNGINGGLGRHRFYAENTRSINNYLHNLILQGNDNVVGNRCEFGGSRLHSVQLQSCSNNLISGAKIWGAGTYRSNNAIALQLQDVNNTTVVGNVIQDTVNVQGTHNTDRGITISGNNLTPLASVFSADGVTVGSADASYNAFIRIQGNDMVTVGVNDAYAVHNGSRFLEFATLQGNARAHLTITGSSETGNQGWATTAPVPVSVEAGSTCTVDLKDVFTQSQRFTGQVQIGLTLGETVPTGGFGTVIGQSLPVLLGGNASFAKAKQLMDASSFIIHTIVEGETYVIPDTAQIVVFEASASINTFHLTLPANPGFNSLYGNHLVLEFKQHVSALVLAPSASQTIRVVNGLGQPGTANIDQRMEWVFRAPSSTWEWVAGTTGTNTFTGSDFGNSLLNTANASTARTALGLGSASLNNTGDFTPISHATDTGNPHQVTKTQVGLPNVDNTSDVNKPVSTATQTALNLKADKTIFSAFGTGFVGSVDAPTARVTLGLGTAATFASTAFAPIAHVTDTANPHGVTAVQVGLGNVNNTADADKPISTAVATALATKVGTNAFTTYSFTLVNASTAAGARSVLGLGSASQNDTADFTPHYHLTDLNNPHQTTKSQVGLGNVDNTSDVNKPISTAVAAALALKPDTSTFSTYGTGLVSMQTAALARSYLALGTVATYNVPTSGNATTSQVVIGTDTRLTDSRTPVTHTQPWSTITGTPTTLTAYGITDAAPLAHVTDYGNPHQVTKAQIGLSVVDNTADINKPLSNAMTAALFTKINVSDANALYTPIAHATNYFNPHNVTAAQIGLDQVNNTSDANKPISTATQTALSLKFNAAALTSFGVTWVALANTAAAQVALGIDQVNNTSDANKPISTATQTALDAKIGTTAAVAAFAPIAHVSDTANPHAVSKAQVGLDQVDNTSDANKPISSVAAAALLLKTNVADLANTGNTFGVDLIAGSGRVVNNVAALKTLLKTGVGRAFVLGYYAPGDGGGGLYYYDSTDTTSADNGGSILLAADNGRWKLASTSYVTLKQFGAKMDGTTDDTAAVANHIASGITVRVPEGICVSGKQTITSNVTIRGVDKYKSTFKSKNGCNDHLFYMVGDYRLDITDVGMDGNYTNNTFSPNEPCGVLVPIGSLNIQRCYLTGWRNHAIHTGNTDWQYAFGVFAHDVTIIDNVIDQLPSAAGLMDCIRIHRSINVKAHRNKCTGGLSSVRSNWFCSFIDLSHNIATNNRGDVGVTFALSSDVTGIGNECTNLNYHGIEVDACVRGVIANNICNGNQHSGIFMTEYGPAGGTALFTGSISGTILTVSGFTSVNGGSIVPGQVVGGIGIADYTLIQAYGTAGTTGTGGNGTYSVSISQTLASTSMGSASPAFCGYLDGTFRAYPLLYPNKDVRVDNNVCTNNVQFGIHLIGQSGVTVSNNTVDNNNVGNTNPWGMFISGGASNVDNVYVVGNNFKNTGNQLGSIGQDNVQFMTRTGGNTHTMGTKQWQFPPRGKATINGLFNDPYLLNPANLTVTPGSIVEDTTSSHGFARQITDSSTTGNVTMTAVLSNIPPFRDRLLLIRLRTPDTMTAGVLNVNLYTGTTFKTTFQTVNMTGLSTTWKEYTFYMTDSLKSYAYDNIKIDFVTDTTLTGSLNIDECSLTGTFE